MSAAMPLAVAAAAALALVFAYSAQEPISKVFPASFLHQASDKLPLVITDRPFQMSLGLIDEARIADPKALEESPDSNGQLVYHEYLQKAIVDWIAVHHIGHWRMEFIEFEGGNSASWFSPLPDAKFEEVEKLSADKIRGILSENRFASVHSALGTMALPPATSLTVETPKGATDRGEIRFKNRFCDLAISTSPGFSVRGLGSYSVMVGTEISDQNYWKQEYIVRINASFTPWLVGHPRMKAIREWANGIASGLQKQFDEQIIWRKTVEGYLLRRHLPPEIGDRFRIFGPLLHAPKAPREGGEP